MPLLHPPDRRLTPLLDSKFLVLGKRRDLEREPNWQILVPDASTALMCLRSQWGHNSIDIARELLARNIRFYMVTPLATQADRVSPPPVGLGWRNVDYVPDAFEFYAYEAERDAFLRGPRGTAALLVGGIVGRIARDVLDPNDALAGPSKYVSSKGSIFESTSMGLYTGDELTEEEKNLICGVYKLATGKIKHLFFNII